MNFKIRQITLSFVTILIGFNLSFSQTRISEKFDKKPLNEVLEQIAKSYKIKFAYDNEVVSSIMVTGIFRNQSIDEVLSIILKDSKLEVLFINDVYILKQKVEIPPIEQKIEPVKPIKYKILGIVKEKETGESLPYASIEVIETKNGTSTNTDGYFSISSDQTDSLTIKVTYLGFQPFQLKVAPLVKNNLITIELNRNSTEISDVVIVKKQQEFLAVEDSPGVFQWNSKKNSNPPALSNLDIAAPLQLLPGIDGTTESLSGLVVRHSLSDKNLFVYDGFTIYHIDHFFGAFTSFNSKAIKDIRITRGGFDSRWGGRASSVVEITGKTGNENKLVADIGSDQLSTDIELEGPIGKKLTFVVAARRSFTDIYRSDIYYNLFESARSDLAATKRVPESLTDPDKPGYFYYDLNAKLSFKPGLKDVISISGYQGYDKLNLDASGTIPVVKENSNWGNEGVGLRWSRQWNSVFYHNITAGISQYNLFFDHLDYKLRKRLLTNIYDTTVSHTYLTDNRIDDININFNGELKLGDANTLEFGLTENSISVNAQDGISHYSLGNKIVDTLRVYDNKLNNLTFWAQNSISKGVLKSFKFGSRVTYNNLTRKFYVEPRTQLSLAVNSRLSIKMAAGLYYQFINKILSYSNYTYKSIWKLSEGKRFPVVKSTHLIGGFMWDIGNGFSLDFEGYSKFTKDISFEQTIIKRVNTIKVNQEQVVLLLNNTAYGADFLLKKNWSKGQSWVSYSLSRSLNQCDKLNGGIEYPALDDHLSELKIVNVFDIKRWSITTAWIYGSGKPWDEILLTPTLVLSPDYSKNSAQLAAYHRMDVGIGYTIKMKNADFKVGAKIFNLYNHVNILSKPYQLSENPILDLQQKISPIVYTEIPGMGFTSTLFVNIRF